MADARGGAVRALDLTGPEALRPFVVAGLVRAGRTVLAVTATSREAEDLVEALGDLLDPAPVAYYPSWETLPHERLSPRSDTVGRRLAVLRRLRHPGDDATQRPAAGRRRPGALGAPAAGQGPRRPRAGRAGPRPDARRSTTSCARLADAAYSRVDLVEKRGEFAVRGGIVDVFPPTEEHPLRVEFWGDDVEEIRSFSVADQRTLEKVERLWAPPCRELLLTDEVRARAAELGRSAPAAARAHRQDRRRHRDRGHGVAGAGARRRDGAARRPAARRHPRAGARPRAGPPPRPRPGRHQRGVPRRQLGGRRRRRHRADRPRRRVVPLARRRPRAHARAGQAVVDASARSASTTRRRDADLDDGAVPSRALPAQAGRGLPRRRRARDRRPRPAGAATATASVVLHPGHGPAQRMREVLGEHDVPARLVDDLGAAAT